MKRRDGHSTKLNNGGLSLIELLIAMTIIVIVASAFFSGFVIAAKTNSKAKLQHKATSLAQNILEGLKAEDMDEIMRQFGWPTYTEIGSETPTTNFTILTDQKLTSEDDSDSDLIDVGFLAKDEDDNDKTYFESTSYSEDAEYEAQNDGKYYLYLKNLKMENTAFDALITLDGSDYMQIGGNAAESGQDFNTSLLYAVPMMDMAYDAICSTGLIEQDEAAYVYFKNEGLTPVASNVSRNVTITVDNTDYVLSQSFQRVTVEYTYTYKDGENSKQYTGDDLLFTNVGNRDNQLRNVFLFIPLSVKWDGSNYEAFGSDTVTLEVPEDWECDFYIIKSQESDDTNELLKQDLAEEDIILNVKVKETTVAGKEITKDKTGVNIRSNLGVKLTSSSIVKYTKSLGLQAKYYLNVDETPVDVKLVEGSDGSMKYNNNALHTDYLAASETKERILDVTIDIYDHSDDRDVTGGPNEYAGGEEPRTTLTGSIRN